MVDTLVVVALYAAARDDSLKKITLALVTQPPHISASDAEYEWVATGALNVLEDQLMLHQGIVVRHSPFMVHFLSPLRKYLDEKDTVIPGFLQFQIRKVELGSWILNNDGEGAQ